MSRVSLGTGGGRVRATLHGDLDEGLVGELRARLAGAVPPAVREVELAMAECDAADPIAMVEAVGLVRDLLDRGLAVTVWRAPQLLAHDLYRVGLLEEKGRLSLREPRLEEPASS